jgi:hypothetical protein
VVFLAVPSAITVALYCPCDHSRSRSYRLLPQVPRLRRCSVWGQEPTGFGVTDNTGRDEELKATLDLLCASSFFAKRCEMIFGSLVCQWHARYLRSAVSSH